MMEESCETKKFGYLADGRSVELWTLRGRGGMVMEAMTYGGAVVRLLVPDREGRLDDVVLGFSNLADYTRQKSYFGCNAGRVAGRITQARFELDGRIYEMASNDPPNHLHGGCGGFDTRLWRAEAIERTDGAPSVRFSYLSPDGEDGYPGGVRVSVTYSVTDVNALIIDTHATCDCATPFGLTHHSYFNLAGEGSGDVMDHLLRIDADHYVPTDDCMGLSGRRDSVFGTPNDLREPRQLREVIPRLHQKHGELYLLDHKSGSGGMNVAVAELYEPVSGRLLEVLTSESCLQFYSGHSLGNLPTGKSGRLYGPYSGLCLECESYPDGVRHPEFGEIILRPGHIHERRSAYVFSTR